MARRKKQTSWYSQEVKIPVRITERENKVFHFIKPIKTLTSFVLVLLLVLVQTQIFSAFETHIISVTAQIDNGIADYLVINKVYYDVDDDHGRESKNEWLELYNPTGQDINIKDWQICNREECKTIHPNVSVPPSDIFIPASGFALLSHDHSTWTLYWEVPDSVITINLGTAPDEGWLDNDADMLILKDSEDNIIDQMNWGIPDESWINYNPDVWNPGIPDVPEGNMLGRDPNGFDTNKTSDWKEFGIPVVTVIIPNGGELWWVGRTYTLEWIATNPVGDANNLSIDIYYSADSGKTWANIIIGTENDGAYDWRVPLFLNGYYVPSDNARIKVVANNSKNFIITAWDMSDEDFCPPIDYDLLTPEELEMLKEFLGEEIIVDLPDIEPIETVTPSDDGIALPDIGESIDIIAPEDDGFDLPDIEPIETVTPTEDGVARNQLTNQLTNQLINRLMMDYLMKQLKKIQ